jgi:cellobiose-specific phosphotransferase system component IIC
VRGFRFGGPAFRIPIAVIPFVAGIAVYLARDFDSIHGPVLISPGSRPNPIHFPFMRAAS